MPGVCLGSRWQRVRSAVLAWRGVHRTRPVPAAARLPPASEPAGERDVTNARGPEAGPLTAVFGGQETVPVPTRGPSVVDFGTRAGLPPEAQGTEHVRQHQAFLGRVVDYLCHDTGIEQFVDWNCPVPGATERIRAAAPGAAVVHVAPDGAAGSLSAPDTAVLAGDGSGPEALMHRLDTCGLLDFDRPVAFLMTRPFTDTDPLTGAEEIHALMRGGGYLALCSTAARAAAERAFAPFTLVAPGLADLTWWPYPDEDVAAPGSGILAGLGSAPGRQSEGVSRWR